MDFRLSSSSLNPSTFSSNSACEAAWGDGLPISCLSVSILLVDGGELMMVELVKVLPLLRTISVLSVIRC